MPTTKTTDRAIQIMRARMLGQTCDDCRFRETTRIGRYSDYAFAAYCQKRDYEPKNQFCVQFRPYKPG